MSEIKLCKDCKHYTKLYATYGSYCGIGKIDLVHGEPCEQCSRARTSGGSCGIEAKNFEQKPEPAPKPEPAFVEFNFPHQKERVWWNFWR